MYYPSGENKGADQLRSYCEADLRLCFRIGKITVFSRCGSYVYTFYILYNTDWLPNTEIGLGPNNSVIKRLRCILFCGKIKMRQVTIHTHIYRHTCDISLFRRDLPIFEQISLFRISKFPYLTYTSPYFKFQISLFEIKNFLLCLIILPILESKSPYLASQMYHMYAYRLFESRPNLALI